MALLQCVDCGHHVSDLAPGCPSCGRPVAPSYAPVLPGSAKPRSEASTERNVFAILGGAALLLGPFLPWMTLGRLTASGIEKTDSEALALSAMGLVGALIGIVSLSQKRDQATWALVLVALGGGGLTVYYQSQLRDQIGQFGETRFVPDVGMGIYVCFVGVALLLLSVISSLIRRRT
jgi:O-antigen/teichoic acid export membrane protein